MSDKILRHGYYEPNILIPVGTLLDCPFPPATIELTGQELLLLRSMIGYLERDPTYVAEYHDGYYLSPDDEQWDEIEAIVAALARKLMGT